MNRYLDYKDISIIPSEISEIESRSTDIKTNSLLGKFNCKIPIIGSPMKDVCNGHSVNKLIELGCFGIIHRFNTVDEQIIEFNTNKLAACAIGINGDYLERFQLLYKNGCRLFCIDVANGASIFVEKTINQLLKIHNDICFIVGNVASPKTYKWCSSLPNVIGVRVGIAGGKACTTRNSTGVYCPMFSLIQECKSIKEENDACIIADGGINEPQDFCKAIIAGADFIMLGSVLSKATDSPAESIFKDGAFYKIYHGSASFDIQKIYKDSPKYIEGKTILLDSTETIEQIITRFHDGLVSSMSYLNAKSILLYQKNAKWCII